MDRWVFWTVRWHHTRNVETCFPSLSFPFFPVLGLYGLPLFHCPSTKVSNIYEDYNVSPECVLKRWNFNFVSTIPTVVHLVGCWTFLLDRKKLLAFKKQYILKQTGGTVGFLQSCSGLLVYLFLQVLSRWISETHFSSWQQQPQQQLINQTTLVCFDCQQEQ